MGGLACMLLILCDLISAALGRQWFLPGISQHPAFMAIASPVCHNSFMVSNVRDIQRHVLPNGLIVITETMQHVRSVSVGIWVRNGSRREVPAENGLAHFLEHMPIAFDVLADLVLRPKLDSDDVNKERQVVLEEIKMDLDNPEYLLHDIF